MGLLKKPYEISLWEDEWDSLNKKFDETRTLTIGSSEMEYPGRAIEPNLVRKTNGEVSFSFKMYYQFVDTTTGETVNNPFVDYIANETKIKLKYGDEWFDLLVKNVHKDSATKSYTYQLVDQHMTELSKNGFNVQLDSKLFNNLDTAEGLGLKVLQNTDWGVESEKIVQTQDEALVMLKVSTEGGIQAYQINDTNLTENGAMPAATTTTIPKDACIYAFYSSCSGEKPYRFQFIYKKTDRGEGKNPRYVYDSFEIQSDRIIADQNCQYYIDGITEWVESSGFTIPKDFAIDTRETSLDGINNKSAISVLYRGRRYVYSQTSEYHPGLDIYLEKYEGAVTNAVDGYFKYDASEAVWKSWGKLGTQDTWSYYTDGHKPEDEKMFPVGTIVKVENSKTSYKPIYLLVTNSLIQSEAESGPRYYYEAIVIDNTSTQYYKYTKTEYVAPSLIQNVVNNAEFKGTSAWKGSKFLADGNADIDGKPASSPEFSTTVEAVSMYDDGNVLADATDVMLGYTAVNNEGVIGNTNYKPYLRCGNLHQANDITKAIINSGTSDTVAFQQGITEGEQYIFDIEAYLISKVTQFHLGSDSSISMVTYSEKRRVYPQIVVANFDYDASLNGYDTDDYTNRTTSEKVLFEGNAAEDPVILAAKNTVTPEKMRDDNYQIFLFPGTTDPPRETTDKLGVHYHTEYFVLIKKIQFYKFYSKGENSHYTPDDDMSSTEVSYVVEDRYFPVIENDTRTLDEITFAPTTNVFTPVLSADGSKKSTVNVKESNYFNAIQAIASTFECWPQLEVNHDATGKIVNFPSKNYSKRIHFKNYVGQKNHVGFKYGVNSKDIKRTLDSNQIVSKLIVKANSNEYAPNGFCTIARAPANSIKDNVLYNFDYYVSQQMLNATALQNDLHIAGETEGQTPSDDITRLKGQLSLITLQDEDWAKGVLGSCTGYYPKMRLINQKLENLQKLIAEKNTPLIAETATYNTYKAMYEAAVSDLEEQQDRFFKLAGCAYNAIPDNEKQEEVMNSTTLFSTLQTIAELATTEQDAKTKYEAAEENMEAYSSAILTLENQQKNAILLKKVLNNMFYTRYSRFIQEGTWIDESYLDESLYYNDALSVSYNSAMPKVTYSMNVLSLAGLPGYELFDFKVGDQTFVEDTEFFGYDTTGTPIRAEVTITQTSENLDDPTRNTIQIRNYENQFEDLFQRINATVQSVQYSEGSYKKAAEFVEADAAHKFSFLNDALSAAEAYIGDTNNTVVVDTSGGTGITITDKNNAEQALRLTSGAILLKGTNPDTGEKVWKTGLTAEGISASLINAGILNTGEINIMNGSETTFRWDTHGITAYNFDNSTSDTFFSIDKEKGVRFDRFGLYGYSGINGETWRPTGINTGINSIEEYSTFYLTWEGLKVKGNDDSILRIGKNAEGGSILSVTKGTDSILTIGLDGSLSIKGRSTFSIGGDPEKPNFHVDADGNVKMRGGIFLGGNISWGEDGPPEELKGGSGRGISSTTTDYQKHSSGTEPPTGSWSATVPSISSGEFLWTRTTFTYTDNTTSVSYGVSSKGSRGSSGTSITVAGVQYAKGENATTPPTSGWSMNIPAVSGTYPYLWTRTVFSDGSEAYNCSKNTITKDELWSFLGTDDGIYENNGNIAIRATAIISGALQVGGTKGQPNSEGVKFYADITNNEVKIGNWNVGDLGGGFTNSLYSTASDNTDTYNVILRASAAPTDYAFAIIKNLGATGQEEIFGIHHNGKLYARNIEIAGGTISLGDNFYVDEDGNLVAYNCDLNGFTFKSSTDGKASTFSSKGGSYALTQYNNNEAEFFLNENSKIRIGQGGLKLTNDTITTGHSYKIATATTYTVSEIGIGYKALIPSFAPSDSDYPDNYNVGIQLYKRSDYGSGSPYAPAGWAHICLDEFGRIQARTATWQVNENQDGTADPRNEGAPRLKKQHLVYAGTLKIQGDLYVNNKEITKEIASLKLEVQQLHEELAALKNNKT